MYLYSFVFKSFSKSLNITSTNGNYHSSFLRHNHPNPYTSRPVAFSCESELTLGTEITVTPVRVSQYVNAFSVATMTLNGIYKKKLGKIRVFNILV